MAITFMYYKIECNTLIKLQENIYLLQPKEEKNSMTQRLHSTDTHRELLYGALMSQGRLEPCQNSCEKEDNRVKLFAAARCIRA